MSHVSQTIRAQPLCSSAASPAPQHKAAQQGPRVRSRGLRPVVTRCGPWLCTRYTSLLCPWLSIERVCFRAIDMQTAVVSLGITAAAGAAFYNSMKASLA